MVFDSLFPFSSTRRLEQTAGLPARRNWKRTGQIHPAFLCVGKCESVECSCVLCVLCPLHTTYSVIAFVVAEPFRRSGRARQTNSAPSTLPLGWGGLDLEAPEGRNAVTAAGVEGKMGMATEI